MSKSNNPRLSVTEQAREALYSVGETEGLAKKQLPTEAILFLYEFYQQHQDKPTTANKTSNTDSGKYDAVEQEEIDKAIKNSGQPLEVIVREGTLQRVRYLNSIASKQAELDSMSDEEIKESRFKGAANYRISQAVEKVMEHNNNQTEKADKVCLTKGIIFKLTGSNRQTISKYFDESAVMISDHNHKHLLSDSDNRKGKGFDFKKLLGV